jgi:hypothetical protein
MTTKGKRHWLTSWNRHRTVRLVLSCTPEEATLVRELAAERGETVQAYLMHLVLRAAARSRRQTITTKEDTNEN